MIKKLLAAALGLVIFLIFWFIGVVIVLTTGIPILLGMAIWTLIAAKIFERVYNALT